MKFVTITFFNPTTHTITLDSIGLESVGPGESIDVPIELAAPTRKDNGTRGKSAIEQVAPQLHPKLQSDQDAWKITPPPATPVSKIVTTTQRAASEAPGVKALREARQASKS